MAQSAEHEFKSHIGHRVYLKKKVKMEYKKVLKEQGTRSRSKKNEQKDLRELDQHWEKSSKD